MSSKTSRRKLTLGLLQALVQEVEEPVAFLEKIALVDRPLPSDAEARIRYLAGRLGLRETDPDDLGALWARALARGKRPTRIELLDLARRTSTETLLATDDAVGLWRRAAQVRFASLFGQQVTLDSFTPETPPEVRDTCLELHPLFDAWPRRLLHDREWVFVEAPLPEMNPLPLNEVWVDLALFQPQDTFDFRSAGTFQTALELHHELRRWRTIPLEAFIDRLAGSAMLIGPPGSGKTTLLKWVARRLILSAGGRYLLPLFVPLRSFGIWKQTHPEFGLLDYALSRAGISDPRQRELWRQSILKRGGANGDDILLLLDGWDEVRDEDRESLRAEIESVVSSLSILLTSRPSGYPRSLPIYELYEIFDLSRESADTLVQRWFAQASAPDRAEILRSHLNQRHDLQKMARNPFLLTLLCGLYLRGGRHGQGLPASRSELYWEALQLIYAHHNQRYPSALLDQGRQRQIESLALWLLDEAPDAPRYVFGQEDLLACGHKPDLLERYLKPSRLLSHWSLAEDTYHFLHTTFHEFLAARALTHEPPELARDRLHKHLNDVAWQEVLVFLAGQQVSARESFWLEMARQAAHPDRFGHIFLRLAQLVAEARWTDGGKAVLGEDVREHLWKGILSFSVNAPFVDAYNQLDAKGLADRIRLAFPTAEGKEQTRLLHAMARARGAESSDVLVEQILSGTRRVAGEAFYQIHLYGRVSGTDLDRLRTAATFRRNRLEIRKRAIRALGHLKDFSSVSLLCEIGREKKSLALDVVQSLGWMGGAEAAKSLYRLFFWYSDHEWQREVVLALGDIQDPLSRDLLLDLLANREAHPDLIIFILGSLSEKPIHHGVEMITSILHGTGQEMVRSTAAEALIFAKGPGVREALVRAAQLDAKEEVRIDSLKALERHAEPSDVPWLTGRIHDSSLTERERSKALDALLSVVQRYGGSAEGPGLKKTAAAEVLTLLLNTHGKLAISAATHLAGEEVAPRLVEICMDSTADWTLREFCCLSLRRLQFAPAIPELLRLVRETPEIEDDKNLPQYQKGQRLAWEAAKAIAYIDPGLLLAEPGTTSAFALAQFALERGSLVFSDLVLGPDGREVARVPASSLAAVRTGAVHPTRPAQPGLLTPDLEVKIRYRSDPPEVSFELRSGNPVVRLTGETFGPIGLGRRPQDYTRDLIKDIEGLSSRDKESQRIAINRLGAKGAGLLKALIPEDLQRLLWDLQGCIRTIQILSDEPHIPWEILKLQRKGPRGWESGPFLCEAFAVTRWLRGVPQYLQIPMRRIALVAPRAPDLPHVALERKEILALRNTERDVEQIRARYSSVIEAFRRGAYDSWHFTGHGSTHGDDSDRWCLWLEDRQSLQPEDLNEAAGPFIGNWVFLNACYAGRSGISLAGMGGWAKKFLDMGAGVFVGPHWAVSDHWAREFAKALYRRFLAGMPLGEAVHATRLEIRDMAPGDPGWLAYAVFGHPLATCGAPTTRASGSANSV